jgi:uracil-DNA glycosylase
MAVHKLFDEDADRTDLDRERALEEVRADARDCRNCPLWEIGTQTVFGVGPANARMIFIGEAPGFNEDKEGIPFIGPAGRLFDQALAQAGIERDDVYVTNIVKHRPWVDVAGRAKNRAPKQSEIKACRPWLQHELTIVEPEIVICVGAPAAKQILGKDFRLMEHHGQWFSTETAPNVMAVIHPAFVLIQTDENFDRWRSALFADFRTIAERYGSL